ncbi:hypothetical protein DKM44_02210 [Deinococcus irradiatisoli]|uniref:Uncharacterized protein n=1 Tax=Deinococcus irradiatisoli TaxID=2202254 RepID=A0A2Z3JMT2_9DEIO|nr:hypothetical protein DKM44_02210 [Deinococcus irradiatisoli]
MTLEQEMQAWGERYLATQKAMTDRAREARQLHLRWIAAGNVGDFSTALAKAARVSRTTAWRAWRAGIAIEAGVNPKADQTDLIDAARALDSGVPVEEINTAITNNRVRDLANIADIGSVGRRMTPEAAGLREQVQRRLGLLGLDHLPPAERDELVFSAFMTVPDETLRAVIKSYRKGSEGAES